MSAQTPRRSGSEPFHRSGTQLGPFLRDFWSWADSNLLSNTLRGRLAEYLVAVDLGLLTAARTEWLPYDLESPSGVTVEVKSAAYIQSWQQRRPSKIIFGIAPKLDWDPDTGEFGTRRERLAQVYVFALLGEKEQAVVDPLDVDHWRFYVLSTVILNRRLRDQKTLTFPSLLRLSPTEVRHGAILAAVESAARVQ